MMALAEAAKISKQKFKIAGKAITVIFEVFSEKNFFP